MPSFVIGEMKVTLPPMWDWSNEEATHPVKCWRLLLLHFSTATYSQNLLFFFKSEIELKQALTGKSVCRVNIDIWV